jgi:valyl-tRNA synthetase
MLNMPIRCFNALWDYGPGKSIAFHVMGAQGEDLAVFQSLADAIGHLARGPVSVTSHIETASQNAALLRLAADGVTVGVTVEGDVDLIKALDRMTKQKMEAAKEINRISGKLSNAGFVEKAAPEVVQEHHSRFELLTRDHDILERSELQLRDILRLRTA